MESVGEIAEYLQDPKSVIHVKRPGHIGSEHSAYCGRYCSEDARLHRTTITASLLLMYSRTRLTSALPITNTVFQLRHSLCRSCVASLLKAPESQLPIGFTNSRLWRELLEMRREGRLTRARPTPIGKAPEPTNLPAVAAPAGDKTKKSKKNSGHSVLVGADGEPLSPLPNDGDVGSAIFQEADGSVVYRNKYITVRGRWSCMPPAWGSRYSELGVYSAYVETTRMIIPTGLVEAYSGNGYARADLDILIHDTAAYGAFGFSPTAVVIKHAPTGKVTWCYVAGDSVSDNFVGAFKLLLHDLGVKVPRKALTTTTEQPETQPVPPTIDDTARITAKWTDPKPYAELLESVRALDKQAAEAVSAMKLVQRSLSDQVVGPAPVHTPAFPGDDARDYTYHDVVRANRKGLEMCLGQLVEIHSRLSKLLNDKK